MDKLNKHDVLIEAINKMKKGQFKATAIKVELEANMYRNMSCEDALRFVVTELAGGNRGEEIGVTGGQDRNYHYWAETHAPMPGITYMRFYDDGSVDSELTFTVDLKHPENIYLLPKVINAFKALGEAEDHMDVSGAGMHMALLNTSDCSYSPTARPGQQSLVRFRNFRRSMQLLLPALYFLGTTNEQSRGLRYRIPQIEEGSNSNNRKYSAISYRNRSLEFRVFDTCYDTPEAILDNVVVMANCLRYWRDNYISSGVDKIMTGVYFGVDNGNDLKRFYGTVEHVDLLNAGLKKIKPSYYGIKELKAARKFDTTKAKVKAMVRDYTAKLRLGYDEYSERFDWDLRLREAYRLADKLEHLSFSLFDTRAEREEAVAKVKKEVEMSIEEERRTKESLGAYVRRRSKQYADSLKGMYHLGVE